MAKKVIIKAKTVLRIILSIKGIKAIDANILKMLLIMMLKLWKLLLHHENIILIYKSLEVKLQIY